MRYFQNLLFFTMTLDMVVLMRAAPCEKTTETHRNRPCSNFDKLSGDDDIHNDDAQLIPASRENGTGKPSAISSTISHTSALD
jgi:hypothetical protein